MKISIISATIITLIPTVVLAQASGEAGALGRLTAIPFVDENATIGELVYGLFLLAIVLAAVLAVVKLVIAGVKYMTSDVVTSKQSAIGDIKGAILGLLLILTTIIIVDTINPDIANTNLELEPINVLVEGQEGGDEDQTLEEFVASCEGQVRQIPDNPTELECITLDEDGLEENIEVENEAALFAAINGIRNDDTLNQEPVPVANASYTEDEFTAQIEEEDRMFCQQQGGNTVRIFRITDEDEPKPIRFTCWRSV